MRFLPRCSSSPTCLALLDFGLPSAVFPRPGGINQPHIMTTSCLQHDFLQNPHYFQMAQARSSGEAANWLRITPATSCTGSLNTPARLNWGLPNIGGIFLGVPITMTYLGKLPLSTTAKHFTGAHRSRALSRHMQPCVHSRNLRVPATCYIQPEQRVLKAKSRCLQVRCALASWFWGVHPKSPRCPVVADSCQKSF